jgi:hypothetical protein
MLLLPLLELLLLLLLCACNLMFRLNPHSVDVRSTSPSAAPVPPWLLRLLSPYAP